jgi:hypothetical protein
MLHPPSSTPRKKSQEQFVQVVFERALSWLGLCGVDPRAQTMLARHAPTGITQRHDQDFSLFDLWAEIDKRPPVRWTEADAETVRATGTDNSQPRAVVRPVVRNVGREAVTLAADDRMQAVGGS